MTRRPCWAVTALLLSIVLAAAACGDDGGDVTQGVPAPGGGLTVAEAMSSDVEGPLSVTGFLIEAAGTTRLCTASLESMAPQCGEPSLVVEGVVVGDIEGAQTVQGVTWVDQATLTGTVQDSVIQVSDTSI